MRYSFANDYCLGADVRILKALVDENFNQKPGYSFDQSSDLLRKKVQDLVGDENAHVFLVAGGTLCNVVALSHFLRPYEAAMTLDSGHIVDHEAGSIEAHGHKVITTKGRDGKVDLEALEEEYSRYKDCHMVKPRLLFISNATELGTTYTKSEMIAISKWCHERDMLLYVDGARLANALALKDNDLSLKDLYELSDAFYIGGTKNGLLFGEVLVIKGDIAKDMYYLMKQNGALLAKGFVLSEQFLAYFKDDLYLKLADHANKMADLLRTSFKDMGIELASSSKTNQVFVKVDPTLVEYLQKEYEFSFWGKEDDKEILRFVTSFGTPLKEVEDFTKYLRAYHG